jgi:hypothetical protein
MSMVAIRLIWSCPSEYPYPVYCVPLATLVPFGIPFPSSCQPFFRFFALAPVGSYRSYLTLHTFTASALVPALLHRRPS